MEEKNTMIEFVCHTFDVDDSFQHLTDFTIQYKLKCTMKDGTIKRPVIEEFNLMPFIIGNDVIIDYRNSFVFKSKKYYISDKFSQI